MVASVKQYVILGIVAIANATWIVGVDCGLSCRSIGCGNGAPPHSVTDDELHSLDVQDS